MRRSGFHLVEVLLAVVILGGVLVNASGLIGSTTAGLHGIVDQAATRLALYNTVELLVKVDLQQLRLICQPAGRLKLSALIAQSAAGVDAGQLAAKLTIELQEGVTAGGTAVHLSLSVPDGNRPAIALHRLFRPAPAGGVVDLGGI